MYIWKLTIDKTIGKTIGVTIGKIIDMIIDEMIAKASYNIIMKDIRFIREFLNFIAYNCYHIFISLILFVQEVELGSLECAQDGWCY